MFGKITVHKVKVITVAVLFALVGITLIFIAVTSQPTQANSLPTLRCNVYQAVGDKLNACATCGNHICERFEQCTPTSADPNGCGSLYCPDDCQN